MNMALKSIEEVMKSEYVIIVALFLLCIIISIVTPGFRNINNILNVLQQASVTGIAAIGMTYVIAKGGIDLSIGGTLCLSGMVGSFALLNGMPIVIAIFLMLLTGVLVGATNGFLITKFGFPPIIVTLALMEITRGIVLYITQGRTMFGLPESFGFIGQGYFLSVPMPAWIFLITAIVASVVLTKFSYGRRVLSVGSNARGAWYAGTNVKFITFSVYVVSGAAAAICAVISTSRLLSSNATLGTGLELDAIAAVVIGGTSIAGGTGTILGTVAGALIVEVISNWMNLTSVNPFLRDVIKGVIILIALLIYVIRKGRQNRSQVDYN